MKLYSVHCGFYDDAVAGGIYESHVNLFIAAESFEDARVRIKTHESFKNKRMHVDGIEEVAVVNGYDIRLERNAALDGVTNIVSWKHRELAAKKVD
jgi:hypothetical protein